MCVLDYEGKMEEKKVWSTSDIISNRNNWSLAADAELLKHLQSLSEKIFTQANSTLHSLNSLENDINQTCISVANSSNKFKALSDTQFIESKIQEETIESNGPHTAPNQSSEFKNEDITVKLKEALENGFQVLDSQYDIIPVSGSDSEDDEPQEILLRARNPYLMRRLPYIIGSEEFARNDNLGLVDTSSSEEDDDEEEEDDDDDEEEDDFEEEKKKEYESDHENDKNFTPVIPSPLPRTEFIRPQTQVIRISSSDSEDSEASVPSERTKKPATEKPRKDNPTQIPYSFADHLSAALKNNRSTGGEKAYNVIPPDFGDTFSPPPFPTKDANDISSDDDHSVESVDEFASKKNTKHSISGRSYVKSHSYDESDDNDDLDKSKSWRGNEIDVVSREPPSLGKTLQSSRKSSIVSRTSQYSDSSYNSKLDNEITKKDTYPKDSPNTSQQPVKPKIIDSNVNSLNKKMVSAIGAELNEKLKIKTPIKTNENTPPVKTVEESKPTNKPTPKELTSTKKEVKKPVLFGELDDEVQTSDNDLFSGLKTSKSKTTANKKVSSLFDDDDDDNIDNLFKPSKAAPKEMSKKPKFDDLFSTQPNEPVKTSKPTNELTSKPMGTDLFKKSNLFGSDSDSEDDLFLLIKNTKKTATNVFKTENATSSKVHSVDKSKSVDGRAQPLFDEDNLKNPLSEHPIDSKSKSVESKTQSLFDEDNSKNPPSESSLDKSKPMEDKTPSLFTEKNSKNFPSPHQQPSPLITKNENVSEKTVDIKAENNSKNDQVPEQTTRNGTSVGNITSSNVFEETSKSAVSDLLDDNDTIRKNIQPSFDKQTPERDEIVDASSTHLFADNDKNQIKITDITGQFATSASHDEKFIFETPPEFPKETYSSNESLNKGKIDVYNEKDNIFAKNLISRYSSSEDEEDMITNTSYREDVPPSKGNLFEKKNEFDEKQNIEKTDLFGEKLQPPDKISKSSSRVDLLDESTKTIQSKDTKASSKSLFDEDDDDIFGDLRKANKPFDSSCKKSTIQSPPEDVRNESKIVEISQQKDVPIKSHDIVENPDLTRISSEPIKTSPKNLFDENDDDLFEELGKANNTLDSSGKKSIVDSSPEDVFNEPKIIEKTQQNDVVKKSQTNVENTDFTNTTSKPIKTLSKNLFDEKDDDLFEELGKANKPLDSSGKQSVESPPKDVRNTPKQKDVSEKQDTVVENPDFSDIASNIQSDGKAKDNLFAKNKESILFNFNKKDPFNDDSDSDDLDFLKNSLPVSKASLTTPPLESTISAEKKESKKPESLSISSLIERLNEKVEGISDEAKRSLSPEKEGSENKITDEKENVERKDDSDEKDGNLFTKRTSPEPVAPLTRTVPGKLAINKGLNINVSALLPGANRSSKTKQKPVDEPVVTDTPENETEPSSGLLNNVIKERAKLSGKRRPPSRQARRSRILNNDLFAPTENNDVRTPKKETPLETNKSPPPNKSSSIVTSSQSKMTVEKQIKQTDAKILKVDLFDDDDEDEKMENLFKTIGNQMKKEQKSLIDELSEKQTPSEVPNSLTASKRSESDDDLNFVVQPTQGPLKSFTKGRAKPPRHNVASKNLVPEIPSVISSEEKKSSDIENETTTVKPDIFSDEITPPTSTTTSNTTSKTTTTVKDLFEDLGDDDDLFGSLKSNSNLIVDKKLKSENPVIKESKTPALAQQQSKPQSAKSSKIDIFKNDDEDELFSTSKSKFTGSKGTKKSGLFEDIDDDDNLFGSTSSSKSTEKRTDSSLSSMKAKVSNVNVKPRVVKLRSETVQKDPLTGKDLTSLR